MADLLYRELNGKPISRGYNKNGSSIAANRFVGAATSAAHADAIDTISNTTALKVKGITQKAIASGEVGDVYSEDGMCVIAENDGAGAIAVGDRITIHTTADANEGRCLVASNPSGSNSTQIVGYAETAAAATEGAQFVLKLNFHTLYG